MGWPGTCLQLAAWPGQVDLPAVGPRPARRPSGGSWPRCRSRRWPAARWPSVRVTVGRPSAGAGIAIPSRQCFMRICSPAARTGTSGRPRKKMGYRDIQSAEKLVSGPAHNVWPPVAILQRQCADTPDYKAAASTGIRHSRPRPPTCVRIINQGRHPASLP